MEKDAPHKLDNRPTSPDLAFASRVSSFFNKMAGESDQLLRDSDDPDDRNYFQNKSDKWARFGEDLKMLRLPQSQKSAQNNPHLSTETLGSLVNVMSRNKQDDQDPEDQNSLQLFNESKALFLDSCTKIFPDNKKLEGIFLDQQFQKISDSLSGVQNEYLKLVVGDIASIKNPALLMQGNLDQLIKKIENAVTNAGNMMDNILWGENISQDLQKELAVFIKAIYSLQSFLDDLKFKKTQNNETQKRVGEADQMAEIKNKMDPAKSERVLSFEEVAITLDPAKVKSIEDVLKIVTPQIKMSILQSVLQDVDRRINAGKRLSAEDPNQIIETSKMVNVVGNQSATAPYQFIAIAGTGEFVENTDIPKMKIYNYLKNFLGHDLNNDRRTADLKKYTNMLS